MHATHEDAAPGVPGEVVAALSATTDPVPIHGSVRGQNGAALKRPGPYQLQAAIVACHAEAPRWGRIDGARDADQARIAMQSTSDSGYRLYAKLGGPEHGSYSGVRRTRRSSWALSATTIVEADMSTAPIAGLRVNPAHANTPAASGIATML